jgi:hypothetical protein
VLLGANPESFRPKGLPCPTAGQRQSYLRTFRFVQPPAARTIHAPPPYRDMLLELYARLGVTVSVAAPAAAAAADSRTGIKLNDRGYGAIHFECIGPEAAIELGQALRDIRTLGASAVQLSAPMGDPGLPLLTDAARDLGFFFCGLGPAFADGADTFLLQLLSEPLDTSKLQLFTDASKELVAPRHRRADGAAPPVVVEIRCQQEGNRQSAWPQRPRRATGCAEGGSGEASRAATAPSSAQVVPAAA